MKNRFKKFVVLVMGVMLMFSLSACTKDDNNTPTEMIIKPSSFSKETTDVLKLFDDELQFFDITLNETAKSERITIWIYKDGEWVQAGHTTGAVNQLNRRIAIRLTDTNYDLYSIEDTGYNKYSSSNLDTTFSESMGISRIRIDGETPIELNKEIPIVVKFGTDKDYMKVYDISEDFREYECNEGIAITLTVSDQETK